MVHLTHMGETGPDKRGFHRRAGPTGCRDRAAASASQHPSHRRDGGGMQRTARLRPSASDRGGGARSSAPGSCRDHRATPTMRPLEHAPHAWARLRVDTNCGLRRGAWYRVLGFTRDQAVLEVTRERVPVERRLLQTVFAPPTRWSVVPRPEEAARMPAQWGTRYAVCPVCHGRAPLNDFPREMRCPHCHGTFAIAWDEHYLRRR
jgi:hypothetical protein